MYEEEAKKMREEMEEEVEKRYQQAFQHSFQMVIMRKQKERAQQEAARAAKLQSEAERAERDKVESEERMALMQRDTSNLRKVHEKTKQEKERLEVCGLLLLWLFLWLYRRLSTIFHPRAERDCADEGGT